ncbi:MAG TPA: mycofactocin precursor MftA [Acidimicrobiales bacterium]|jgi:mycofactocin precursor|nr:mycofactocin precursor MftA [Acidimicrobiales bacterium]
MLQHASSTVDPEGAVDRVAPGTPDGREDPAAHGAGDQPLVEEELLVEEISIDGMCGVY